jgi:hypothetical protein
MIRSLFGLSIKAQLSGIGNYDDKLSREDAWSDGANLMLHPSAFLTLLSAFLTLEINVEFNSGKLLALPDDYDPDLVGEYKLVEIQILDPEAFAEVRVKAKKIEKHAKEFNKDVYGKTSPLTFSGE